MLVVTFSGVLYPQMRPPTKQASRFRSTARTSRPSLTNWDLVWPLVFKLLCHVSSNWYLTFSLPPSNLDLFLLRLILCLSPKSSPASAHYLCVTEPGAKSDLWFTSWGKRPDRVFNTQFFWIHETGELKQPRSIDGDGPSNDWTQAYCACLSQKKLHSMKNVWQLRVFVLLFILSLLATFNMGKKNHKNSLFECCESCL